MFRPLRSVALLTAAVVVQPEAVAQFRPNPPPPPGLTRPPAPPTQSQPRPPDYSTRPQDTTSTHTDAQGRTWTVRTRYVWDGHRWLRLQEVVAGQPQLMTNNRPNQPQPPAGPNGPGGPYPQFQPGPAPQFQPGPAPQPQLFYPPPAQPQPVVVTPQPPPAAATETAIPITELPDGPAQRAGLLTGDIILRVDGNRVRTIDGLRAAVGGGGNAVTVTYFRPSLNQVLTLDVAVEDARIGVGIRETPIRLTGP